MIILALIGMGVALVVLALISSRRRPKRQHSPARRRGAPLYWVLVAGLMIFGSLGAASIGIVFLAIGVTLAVVAPRRGNPALFCPPLLAVLAFLTAFVVAGPLGCSTAASEGSERSGSEAVTICTNIVGIDYSGTGNYTPSLLPALAAGLVTAAIVGVLSRYALSGRERSLHE